MAPYPGYAPYPYGPHGFYPSPPTSTLAILAIVFAFVVPPAGLTLGIVALRQIGRTGEGGRGMAVAGIAVGAAFTLICVIYVVALIAFFAIATSNGGV